MTRKQKIIEILNDYKRLEYHILDKDFDKIAEKIDILCKGDIDKLKLQLKNQSKTITNLSLQEILLKQIIHVNK